MTGDLTLAELARLSGVAARTIRFYIARGLLDGPIKAGRAAAYTTDHLERLNHIQSLQAKGRTLSDIRAELGNDSPATEAVPPSPWLQFVVAEDVVVWARADAAPWRIKQLRSAISQLARSIKTSSDGGTQQ